MGACKGAPANERLQMKSAPQSLAARFFSG
jgi:hypothetical protein